ncbi:amino acid adenylation domain-containing protein [Halopseudomonas sabulinigri]|uniref:Amino acid adenylation domain-containing protein n=1 Tax=Halopseudomonas sabulinigri TaxID=472181 RepID=A0A1H1UHY1_9GAMM|nr:non-ribosomal peptide synthetase [Halopseudomonas sabulinigri]SDS71469.1 amino acid adenylation domain-containing protein [Halopseudomonas sabulinigri]
MMPLNAAQQGLWSGHVLNDDKALFNTAECIAFSGKVQAGKLVSAIEQAVSECETLAGCFVQQGEQVHFQPRTLPVGVRRLALSQLDAAETPEQQVRHWALRDLRTPFDLEAELPCRFALLEGEQQDFLYSCVHHIALDGFGTTLLFQRIAAIYSALCADQPVPPAGFGNYAAVLAEENQREADGSLAAARDYWQQTLAELPQAASFSAERAPIAADFVRSSISVPTGLWQRMNTFANDNRLGWADLLLAGLGVQLQMRSDSRAPVLGLMVMNRIGSAALDVPCMQMNIAPLALPAHGEHDLLACAKQVVKAKRSMRKHQHYRYEALRRDLGRVGGEQRLFGPLVNIMPFDHALQYADLSARTLNLSAGPVEDLTIEVRIGAEGVAQLDYDANPGCYSASQLQDLQQQLFALLGEWLAAPQLTRDELQQQQLGVARQQALLGAPEAERQALPAAGCVLAAIRAQAAQQPQALALCQGQQQYSYEQLQTAIEQTAAALQGAGFSSGQRLGVMLQRSPQAIVVQLAALALGGVYVPLDAEQPAERQQHILRSAELAGIVTEAAYRHRLLPLFSGPLLLAGELQSQGRCFQPASGEAAAYLMFTSGSTGLPKGVQISHRALAHFTAAARQRYAVQAGDRVLQFAPFNFDASIEEVFVTLTAGGTLVLRTDAMLQSMAAFTDALCEQNIQLLDLPTAFWNEWVVALASGQVQLPAGLRTVIIGGEAVYPQQLTQWQQQGRADIRLINTYGPTEATVVASSCELQQRHAGLEQLPIGLPLAGTGALILGAGDHPASEGELVLCGPQLASGYLGEAPGGFAHLRIGSENRPVYRTGDRVRLEDGQLVYLGRQDNEFKISGYRIQPGEVEAQLLTLHGIDEACVQGVVYGSGVRRLVAFVAGTLSDARSIKRQLAERLPAAMVPTDYQHYPSLPRTGSGKFDRKRLLAQYQRIEQGSELSGELENRVAAIWQQILGVGRIGAQDNFFELGGQSLQTIQIVNRLAAEFATTVKVSDVFDHPRLQDFCGFLDGRLSAAEESVEMVW